MSHTPWIYFYRYSKLGKPSLYWKDKPNHDIEQQGQSLCRQIIRCRMELKNISHTPLTKKKFDIRHSPVVLDKLIEIIEILVAAYPGVFNDVSGKIKVELKDEVTVCKAFSTFAGELFKRGISWSLVVALLAFSSSLAIECVQHGRSILVLSICDWTSLYIAVRLKSWIQLNGGWSGVVDHFSNMKAVNVTETVVKRIMQTSTRRIESLLDAQKRMPWLHLVAMTIVVFAFCLVFSWRFSTAPLPSRSADRKNFLLDETLVNAPVSSTS